MKIRHLLMSAALMAPMAMYAQQSTPTTTPNDTQTTAPGQKSGHHGMRAHRGDRDHDSRMQEHFEKMSKELNLTDDQKTQVKAAMQDQMTQMKALRADTSLTPDQRKDKAKDIRKATHEKMMAILTDEQKEKMKAMHDKREDRREKKDKDDQPKTDNDQPRL